MKAKIRKAQQMQTPPAPTHRAIELISPLQKRADHRSHDLAEEKLRKLGVERVSKFELEREIKRAT